MADEFKTLREAALAMSALRDQLSGLTKLLGFCVVGTAVVMLAVTGFFYNKLDSVSDTATEVKTSLANIERLLTEVRNGAVRTSEDIGEIKGTLRAGRLTGGPAVATTPSPATTGATTGTTSPAGASSGPSMTGTSSGTTPAPTRQQR